MKNPYLFIVRTLAVVRVTREHYERRDGPDTPTHYKLECFSLQPESVSFLIATRSFESPLFLDSLNG